MRFCLVIRGSAGVSAPAPSETARACHRPAERGTAQDWCGLAPGLTRGRPRRWSLERSRLKAGTS